MSQVRLWSACETWREGERPQYVHFAWHLRVHRFASGYADEDGTIIQTERGGGTTAVGSHSRHERALENVASRFALVMIGVVCASGFAASALVAFTGQVPPVIDEVVTAELVARRSPTLTVAAVAITAMGATSGLIPLVIVMIGLLRTVTGRWGPSIELLATMMVSAGLTTVIKIVTARVRPPTVLEIGHHTTSFAFPSGHTLNTTTFVVMGAVLLGAVVPRRRRWLLWLAAALAAALMGGSRVYLGYHWISDVAAGWFLAGLLVAVSRLVTQRITRAAPRDLTTDGEEAKH